MKHYFYSILIWKVDDSLIKWLPNLFFTSALVTGYWKFSNSSKLTQDEWFRAIRFNLIKKYYTIIDTSCITVVKFKCFLKNSIIICINRVMLYWLLDSFISPESTVTLKIHYVPKVMQKVRVKSDITKQKCFDIEFNLCVSQGGHWMSPLQIYDITITKLM